MESAHSANGSLIVAGAAIGNASAAVEGFDYKNCLDCKDLSSELTSDDVASGAEARCWPPFVVRIDDRVGLRLSVVVVECCVQVCDVCVDKWVELDNVPFCYKKIKDYKKYFKKLPIIAY